MATVCEALRTFLESRKTPANADLIALWHPGLETQTNVAADGGEPVHGKRSAFSDGINTWNSFRIPKDANSNPWFKDYKLGFSLVQHAAGVGCTGWDWAALYPVGGLSISMPSWVTRMASVTLSSRTSGKRSWGFRTVK